MNFQTYRTLSPGVSNQIAQVTGAFRECLKADLEGVYVHGSIALGRFVEGRSDVDILIVTGRRIPRGERLAIAGRVMEIDQNPSPLEMSAIWRKDIDPWRHPAPCQFHYSGTWIEQYRRLISGEVGESFIVDTDFVDADIACHARLASLYGICVYGKPIADAIPEVPECDFWNSLTYDVNDDYDFAAYAPEYFASNVLSLGRVLSYRRERRIMSKYDSAMWSLDVVPDRLRYLISGAMRAWYAGEPMPDCRQEDLGELKRFMLKEIGRPLSSI